MAAAGEIHDPPVKQRYAQLERLGHAHRIGLQQQAARKMPTLVGEQAAVDQIALRIFEFGLVAAERIFGEQRPQCGAVKLGQHELRNIATPKRMWAGRDPRHAESEARTRRRRAAGAFVPPS